MRYSMRQDIAWDFAWDVTWDMASDVAWDSAWDIQSPGSERRVAAASDLVQTSPAGSSPSAGQHCSLLAAGTRGGRLPKRIGSGTEKSFAGFGAAAQNCSAAATAGVTACLLGPVSLPARISAEICKLCSAGVLGSPMQLQTYGGPGIAGESLGSFSLSAPGRVVWG